MKSHGQAVIVMMNWPAADTADDDDTESRTDPVRQQCISAVRIFEISNQIEKLLQYSIRNEHNDSEFSNTYRHQCLTYLTE